MTFIDILKASGTLCEGVGPQRPRVAAALLERCGGAQAKSRACWRTRGPPGC